MKTDFGHIAQIIVAIIGLIGILYSNRRQKIIKKQTTAKNEYKGQVPRKYVLLFWISITLTCINLGIFSWRLFLNENIQIEIVHPNKDSQVSINEVVKGISTNVPNSKMIWIIVYSFSSQKHFPNQSPAQIDKNGNWSSRVSIGSTEDYGRNFYVSAYLTDGIGRNELEKELSKLEFAGLERLPSNIQLYHRISVYRR